MKTKRIIKVDVLARVEGEGGFRVNIRNGEVAEVKFNVFEPPRLFEAFLRGRSYGEAPDITARICGICPIAYMMSSCQAMEAGFGVKVGGQLQNLRRLIYFGEWIESHALHIYMLHAPDFLGYQNAIALAGDHPEILQRGLELKKLGNEIVALIGGREVHPVNIKVGGFYRVPAKHELCKLTDRIKRARDAAYETVRWTATLPFPDFEQDYEFVALSHPQEYAVLEGNLVSNKGLDIPIGELGDHIREAHVAYSTSLQAAIKERGAYVVGPLARFNLNFDKLAPVARQAAGEVGMACGCRNPFKSIVVRSLETLHACETSIHIINAYEAPEKPAIDLQPRAATACGCTEAPRGLCWHQYDLDENGTISAARIVPPTSQNQKIIERDLLHFVQQNGHLDDDDLTWMCEQVVRNYDPCISCSCH